MNRGKRGCWIAHYCMAFACVLLFSSCSKRQARSDSLAREKGDDSKKIVAFDLVKQQEAMLVDIPLPLFDERIVSELYAEAESDTIVLGYKSPLSKSQAIDFFINQMERYGWQNSVCFSGPQALLQFESPDRYCTVSIKEQEPRGSCIFIYIKRASTNARP